jgi:hypothetical protein
MHLRVTRGVSSTAPVKVLAFLRFQIFQAIAVMIVVAS